MPWLQSPPEKLGDRAVLTTQEPQCILEDAWIICSPGLPRQGLYGGEIRAQEVEVNWIDFLLALGWAMCDP
jgi:hypothetical protein